MDQETADKVKKLAEAQMKPAREHMLQTLLADRFKLAAHYETKQLPFFALVLDKPGKTGPQLRPYPDGTP